MSIELPWARIATLSSPRPVLFSGNQEGTLGGPTLAVPRLGDRFAIDVQTTQLRQDSESRLLLAALVEATTADARLRLRQPNRSSRLPFASVVVDGGGQSGTTVLLRGLVPGTGPSRGEFVHLEHGGALFLYMVCAQQLAGANGKVALPIWPMLRFLTVDGEACELANPSIEGQLVGFDGKGATFSKNRVDPMSFSIVERA